MFFAGFETASGNFLPATVEIIRRYILWGAMGLPKNWVGELKKITIPLYGGIAKKRLGGERFADRILL